MHLSLSILEINLPLPVFLHAVSLGLLAIYMLMATSTPTKTRPHPPGNPVLAIPILAISLSYLTTSYMPIAENQFLHASVPVRLILALLAGFRAMRVPPRQGSGQNDALTKERQNLLGIMVYDGLGGLLAGWMLDSWNGRVSHV